jgi:hypothetical protein
MDKLLYWLKSDIDLFIWFTFRSYQFKINEIYRIQQKENKQEYINIVKYFLLEPDNQKFTSNNKFVNEGKKSLFETKDNCRSTIFKDIIILWLDPIDFHINYELISNKKYTL